MPQLLPLRSRSIPKGFGTFYLLIPLMVVTLVSCSSLRANRLKSKSYKEWSKKQEVKDSNTKQLVLHK